MDSTTVEYWRFINSFAPWFSAIGTLAAVILTLFIIRKDKIINLKLDNAVMMTTVGAHLNPPSHVQLKISNNGLRIATLQNIGIRVNGNKYTMLLQPNFLPNELPISLKDGDSVDFSIPFETMNEASSKYANGDLKKIKLFIVTSTGKEFNIKLGKGTVYNIKKYSNS